MSEFNGCNSAQYNYSFMEVSEGDQQLLKVLASYGGMDPQAVVSMITADSVEAKASNECAEARGYFTAIKAMIDAGLRSAWIDNGDGLEPSSTEQDFAVRLAQHGGYPAEWLEEATAADAAEGKAAANAAEAAGYKKALAAMVAAGFKTAWIDNRKQMFL